MTYSNSLALSRQRFTRRNQDISNVSYKTTTLGPISNTIILIVLACLLGFLYLTQVTKTNAYSYKIDSLTKQQSQLQQQHDQLEVASARLQSLDRVASSNAAKNLVSVAPSGAVSN